MKQRNKWFWVFFVIFVIAVGVGAGYYFGQKDREQVYEDLAEENKKPQEETNRKNRQQMNRQKKKTVEIPIDFSSFKREKFRGLCMDSDTGYTGGLSDFTKSIG